MSTTEETTAVDFVAELLVPRGLDTYATQAVATPREREEAERIVAIMREVLTRNPRFLVELGWQPVGITSENDKLRRGFALYAPPSRVFE